MLVRAAGKLAGAALTLCVISIAGCRREAAPPSPVPVEAITLRRDAIERQLRLTGTVRERQCIELSFKVPGTVASFLKVGQSNEGPRELQEGDVVGTESSLVALDSADYQRKRATAQERLAQATSQERAIFAKLTAARTDYQRIRTLRSSNAVSVQNHDDALAQRDALEAEWEGSRGEISAATVLLQQADDDLKHCELFSPLKQVTVSRKYVEANERVAAGQPVLQIMDLSQVRVALGVPDTRLGEFRIGQEMTVVAEALPGASLTGSVSKILPAADLKTRTFEVEVTIDPPRGLKPGMVVTLLSGRPAEMVLMPLTAVQRGASAGDYEVFVVTREANRDVARRKRIQFDGVYENCLCLSVGAKSQVQVGDRVIVAGANRVEDGQPVSVQPVQELEYRVSL